MLPRPRTHNRFALESNTGDGLTIDALHPGATLIVRTRRSSYRINLLNGQQHLVLVEGGVFPEATVVRLSGATFGGSAVKLGWIVVGLRIEFGLGSRRITSSPVVSIAVQDAPQEDMPHKRVA
jgi:hypothetical protein